MLIKTRINNEQKYVKISEPCLDEFLNSAFQKFCISPVSEGVRVYDETGTEVDADVFEEVVQQPNAGVFTITFDNDVNRTSVFTDTVIVEDRASRKRQKTDEDPKHVKVIKKKSRRRKQEKCKQMRGLTDSLQRKLDDIEAADMTDTHRGGPTSSASMDQPPLLSTFSASTMTTPVWKEKVLKDHLDDLTDRELEKFQWYLAQNQREGCRSIPRSQLQGANREETVDTMVQFYGEDGAVETTADIFMRMNRNDLVPKLTEALSSSPVEQPPTQPRLPRLPILPSLPSLPSSAEDIFSCPDLLRRLQPSLASLPSSSCHVLSRSPVEQPPTQAFDLTSKDISCPICQCIFTDPVLLPCGHSFCKACIHRSWQGKISQKCPLCQQVHRVQDPPINFTLKSLIEAYRARNQVDPSGGHRNDSESQQTSLKKKKKDFEKIKQFCESSIEQIKIQSRDTEEKIKKDFQELRHFVDREEEARLAALKKEETEKIRMMHKITEMSGVTFSLSDIVKDVEHLQADNSSLQTFKTQMKRAQGALPDPQGLPEILIDVPKHVENLQVQVWRKMESIIKHAPMEMGTNSASPLITNDATMTTVGDTRRRPESPLSHHIPFRMPEPDEEDDEPRFIHAYPESPESEFIPFRMPEPDEEDDEPLFL